MEHLLIDGKGVAWPADSAELHQQLWTPGPSEKCFNYLVTNLGYASIRLRRNSIAVRWRPTFVSRETLISLVQRLDDADACRVVVSSLRDSWADAIHGSKAAAREALLREFETTRCEVGGFFRSRQRPFETLPASSSLYSMVNEARETQFEFEPLSLWSFLDRRAAGKYILTELSGGELRIVAWGKGYRTFTPDWIAQAKGKRFEDQPDSAYASRAAGAYRLALATGAPVVEDVEASTWVPTRGRMHLEYTRLILPLGLDGIRRLAVSSVERPGIL